MKIEGFFLILEVEGSISGNYKEFFRVYFLVFWGLGWEVPQKDFIYTTRRFKSLLLSSIICSEILLLQQSLSKPHFHFA